MKFIDEATITVQSGDGGRGCVSFRREKFIPRGGPDGGDGGKGGDIVLKTASHVRTLYHFQFKKLFKASKGGNGQGKQKTGKSGQDLVIEIPAGTVVSDAGTGEVLADLTQAGQSLVVLRGGRGGKGNRHFTSSTHRAPKFAQPGEPGQTAVFKLELKLLADAGIVGLPNAGKSTLIRAITSSKAKIAAYPFTTLTPNLGVVHTHNTEPYVVADIPGLIEGAHQGLGLGIQFLRHIERTRLIIHLIDAAAISPEDPLSAIETVNRELKSYSPSLARKPQLVVLSKMDLAAAGPNAKHFRARLPQTPVVEISALTGLGLEQLKKQIAQMLE